MGKVGRFGIFGGQYVPETVMNAVHELEEAYAKYGNDPLLAHFLCQQDLSQHVVDLVCTGVVQVFPLQVDLAAAQIFGYAVCIVQH